MSISVKYYSIIIPIEKILKIKGKDWWDNYLKENNRSIGDVFWWDEYLFRDGGMGMEDIEYLLKFWEEQGLKPKIMIDNQEYWNDVCVVDSITGPTLPCNWLEFVKDKEVGPYVFLKGKPIDKIIGRGNKPI
ncbi:hypothetical protein KKF32_03965 [Patescibacteria group bacterium]|nr:hypothetical protein [Patescibacteria group bacterium]